MARYIDCPTCAAVMAKLSEQFHELYEAVPGTAIKDLKCDHCDPSSPTFNIRAGDKCFAAVLLPGKLHPNYAAQKPSEWMHFFITPDKVEHEAS